MKILLCTTLPLTLFLLPGCGEGSKTADVVQAATRGVAEAGQQLAKKAAELANMSPDEARTQLQKVTDMAAAELRSIKDSETAQRVIAEVERAFDKLVEVAHKLGEKLDLDGLKASVTDMIENFKNDPRVANALESLKKKIDAFTGPGK